MEGDLNKSALGREVAAVRRGDGISRARALKERIPKEPDLGAGHVVLPARPDDTVG
jgi:hypothetical protein